MAFLCDSAPLRYMLREFCKLATWVKQPNNTTAKFKSPPRKPGIKNNNLEYSSVRHSEQYIVPDRAKPLRARSISSQNCEKNHERSPKSIAADPGYFLRCPGLYLARLAALHWGDDNPIFCRQPAGECIPEPGRLIRQ